MRLTGRIAHCHAGCGALAPRLRLPGRGCSQRRGRAAALTPHPASRLRGGSVLCMQASVQRLCARRWVPASYNQPPAEKVVQLKRNKEIAPALRKRAAARAAERTRRGSARTAAPRAAPPHQVCFPARHRLFCAAPRPTSRARRDRSARLLRPPSCLDVAAAMGAYCALLSDALPGRLAAHLTVASCFRRAGPRKRFGGRWAARPCRRTCIGCARPAQPRNARAPAKASLLNAASGSVCCSAVFGPNCASV